MLDLLLKYAQDRNLVVEPGFAPKSARWAIDCDREGRTVSLLPLGDGRQGQPFGRCPDLPPQVVAAGGKERRCHFLIEAAQVVALYKPKPEEKAKTESKHRFFVELLRRASSAMPDLAVFASTLEDEKHLASIQAQFEAQKARPTDKVTLSMEQQFVVDSEAWHDWWRGTYRELIGREEADGADSPAALMRCFATGDLTAPLLTHDKIDGLSDLGSSSFGDPLICFDKCAFRSFGLGQGANAAVSAGAGAAYCAAMNHLVKHHGKRLGGPTVVHWFAEKVRPEEDPLAWLEDPPEQKEVSAQARAAKLLDAIRTGERADLAGNHYYALTLSGGMSRVMVRDWMDGQFEELASSVASWFSDLALSNLWGSGEAKDPSLERLVTALLPPRPDRQKYADWVKPMGAERLHLWHAALKKRPLTHGALARLVVLNARFHQTGKLEEALGEKTDKSNRAFTLSLLYARMALMKAYHLRNPKGGSPIMLYLNENHPHPAYHCGRLMAVYADLQYAAQGDVGAGVIQRYYAAASATPGLILGRLARLSKFHLGKLDPGLAHWYDSRIADIWARIQDEPPTVLTLEAQSLFALGHYQQMANDNARKSKNPEQDNPIPQEEENHG